jgi:phosphatidylserine/phosphatidylglycerophosphate/cardiolipin synthase-like enzyme
MPMQEREPRVVISFPCEPSFLSGVIAQFMPEKTEPFTTDDAFKHIALNAKNRLVLMSPFIDNSGAQWALETFNASPAKRKILICPRDERLIDLFQSFKNRFQENNIELWQFALRHEEGKRKYSIESFHCKIALADKLMAYVGSANLTEHSRNVSLECGVIIHGASARKVSGVVESVLSLSSKIL